MGGRFAAGCRLLRRFVGKLRASQPFDCILELQPLLLQPPELKLIHVDRVLHLADGGVEVPVFLLQVGDFSCQIDVYALCGFESVFLLL